MSQVRYRGSYKDGLKFVSMGKSTARAVAPPKQSTSASGGAGTSAAGKSTSAGLPTGSPAGPSAAPPLCSRE